jgi:hypothetical protein
MPFSREDYERIKAGAEARGFHVLTRYRQGLRRIQFAPIVLTVAEEDGADGTRFVAIERDRRGKAHE